MHNTDLWDLISPEAKLALLISKFLVGAPEPEKINECLTGQHLDWTKFNRIISDHEIYPSAYIILKKYHRFVPPEQLRILESNFYSNLLNLTLLQQELLKLLRYLQEIKIIVLPLKGGHFLLDMQIYADKAYLRPMSDIDILVKRNDYLQVQDILESQGYIKELYGFKEEYWYNKNYHLAFTKKKEDGRSYIIEVHWALDYAVNKSQLTHLWERVKPIEFNQRSQDMLSPEDNLLSLALHQRRFGKMLLLKNACDIGLLLIRFKDLLDWDYILAEAVKARMRTVLFSVLEQTKILFDLSIPTEILKLLSVPDFKRKLIKKFIIKYTFNSSQITLNSLYLKAHFLLYDNFNEPLQFVLSIPQEQFAKFYKMKPYALNTSILYHLRLFYFSNELIIILYRLFLIKLKNLF